MQCKLTLIGVFLLLPFLAFSEHWFRHGLNGNVKETMEKTDNGEWLSESYDRNGNLEDVDGQRWQVLKRELNNEGRLIRFTTNREEYVLEYDNQNLLVKQIHYKMGYRGKKLTRTSYWFYDARGKLVEKYEQPAGISYYDGKGKFVGQSKEKKREWYTYQNIYNAQGKINYIKVVDMEDNSWYVERYNDMEQEVETIFDDGEYRKYKRTVYEYNSNGYMESRVKYYKNGNIYERMTWEYLYDKHKNPIAEYEYKNGQHVKTIHQIITYYDDTTDNVISPSPSGIVIPPFETTNSQSTFYDYSSSYHLSR